MIPGEFIAIGGGPAAREQGAAARVVQVRVVQDREARPSEEVGPR